MYIGVEEGGRSEQESTRKSQETLEKGSRRVGQGV